jgi:hypothetical protein
MADGVKPYTSVKEQHGPCTLLFQRLMHHEGRMLDALTVVDASGSVRHVFFDVTDVFETYATPSRIREAPLVSAACTRVDAERIAGDYLAAREYPRGHVSRVQTLDELTCARPCLYGVPDDVCTTSWIVYVADDGPVMLRSSCIVLLSMVDGRVLYTGGAHDEG